MIKLLILFSIMMHSMPDNVPVDVQETHHGDITIIGYGAVSGAQDGVLEAVTANRMAGLASPSLPADTDLSRYDAIVATEHCGNVGRSGWLVVRNKRGTLARLFVLVVDCQAVRHRADGGSLTDLGLLADVSANAERYWHWRGYLMLEAQDDNN